MLNRETDFVGMRTIGQIVMRATVVSDAIDEVFELAGVGVVVDIAGVGKVGRDRGPVVFV